MLRTMDVTHTRRPGFRKIMRKLRCPGLTLLMWAFGLLVIFPLLWMISSSFKIEAEIFKFPVHWIPQAPTFSNYLQVWGGKYNFFAYYQNSIIVTFATVLGSVVVNTMGGYAFGRLRFRGRGRRLSAVSFGADDSAAIHADPAVYDV